MLRDFKVCVSHQQIVDLRARLARTIWPSEIANAHWEYGANLDYLRSVCGSWAVAFDWREWEAKLNTNSQFLASIDDLTIHFLHVRSSRPNPIPLLVIHGWPSSVFEHLKIIPLLPEFDLVIPSLPGHGFSTFSNTPGLSIFKTAEIFHKLMTQVLGYSNYVAQGGDWGAYAASRLGYLFPDAVIGIHLSYVVGGLRPALGGDSAPLSSAEKQMLEQRARWDLLEGGYEHLQSTKPQTIAFALSDSPAGLAAWILEKWRSWTDCQGRLESKFSRDELLANLSWYWFTNTAASASRLYYETRANPWIPQSRISVPTAIASFPKELVVSPREWAERIYNVSQWTDMPRGGHFAALEEPVLLADDIRKFCLTLA
jgi:pimeloyl-ACP methyl ester carboxylesterase